MGIIAGAQMVYLVGRIGAVNGLLRALSSGAGFIHVLQLA
jgi:hypothetical protein